MRKSRRNDFVVVVSKDVEVRKDKKEKMETKGGNKRRGNENVMLVSEVVEVKKRKQEKGLKEKVKREEMKM